MSCDSLGGVVWLVAGRRPSPFWRSELPCHLELADKQNIGVDDRSHRLSRARQRRRTALEILTRLDLLTRWQRAGEPVLVGSVALDVVVKPDIDLEIYSDRPSATEGFCVLVPCVEMPGVRRLRFTNALDMPDRGLYWRMDYEAAGTVWTIDMWLLAGNHPGPRAVDLVDPLRATLTDELRDVILAIKEEAYVLAEPAPGVGVYEAVIDHGVRSYADFRAWHTRNAAAGLSSWRPTPP